MRRRRAPATLCALIVAGGGGSACRRPAPPVTAVSHRGAAQRFDSARALLAAVARHNDDYRTLRAVHRVVLEIAAENGQREHHACRGVLAVQRPDRLRLVALGPAGLKLFDLLYLRGTARAVSTGPQLAGARLLPRILDSVAADLRAIYRLSPSARVDALRLDAGYSPTNQAPLLEVAAYREGRLVEQLSVFAASLAVARTEEIDAAGDTRTVTFGDYERRGRHLVPRSILVAREGRLSYWLSITVEQLEVDPPLDPRLFAAE